MGKELFQLSILYGCIRKKMISLLLSIALQFFFNKISQQSPQEDTLKASDHIQGGAQVGF